jgi:hypothetical protein
MKKFFSRQYFVSSSLAVIASVAAVAGFVYAATTIGTNVSVDGNLTVSGSSATSTFSTGGFTVGTDQFVVQQTSGRVGIGTTTPTVKLNVNSGDWDGITLSANAPGIHQTFAIGHPEGSPFQLFTDYTAGRALANIYIGGNGTMWITNNKIGINTGAIPATTAAALTVFATGGAPALVTSSGNLGIGTTSPGTLLSVAGDAYFAGTGTTTLRLQTTTASRGTCLEMFDGAGVAYRIFVSTSGVLTVAAGSCK